MSQRVFNFSPGPAVLPLEVLEEVQRNLLALPGLGVSALEIGHRTPWFEGVVAETKANLRKLLNLPDGYSTIFLQGGSRLQFSMVPMNLLRGTGRTADYILTGSWGRYAYKEAVKEGEARVAFTAEKTNFDRLPKRGEATLSDNPAYVYFTSNETIQGVQFLDEPAAGGAPLVCDASSDFLCRPLDMTKYGLLYACAQKNAGPAGVTVVIVRDELLQRSDERLPSMLNYRVMAENDSLYNTPPVFAVYVVMLVTRWLLGEIGGLDKMLELNRRKAQMLYDEIDASDGFYAGHAQAQDRSLMNVTFRLPSDEIEAKFLAGAKERGLHYLKGHRSVGGIRASIYNAMPLAGVERLAEFMHGFRG